MTDAAMTLETLEPRRLCARVKSLTLVDAEAGRDIGVLVNDATINVSLLQTQSLSLRAKAAGGTQSVRFKLDSRSRVDNSAAYTFADSGLAKVGEHQLTVTAYRNDGGKGAIGKLTIRFRVINATLPVGQQPMPQIALSTGESHDRTLRYTDEFNDNSLGRWKTNLWWSKDGEPGDNVGDERISRDNVSVSGGTLNITATKSDDGYTSGLVTSEDLYEFQYGYVEARMKLPPGVGFWTGFWLLPANHDDGRGEIDIMEWVGDDVRELHTSYHVDGREDDVETADAGADLSDGFHTYGVNWTEDTITWYVDGREFHQTANDTHTPMYAILNLAVGGSWPGDPAKDTKFPSTMRVDYIRFWDEP